MYTDKTHVFIGSLSIYNLNVFSVFTCLIFPSTSPYSDGFRVPTVFYNVSSYCFLLTIQVFRGRHNIYHRSDSRIVGIEDNSSNHILGIVFIGTYRLVRHQIKKKKKLSCWKIVWQLLCKCVYAIYRRNVFCTCIVL